MIEGLNFEAWTLPSAGAFSKRFDFTAAVSGYSITFDPLDIDDGYLSVSSEHQDLDEIIIADEDGHATDEASLIRVKTGDTIIGHMVTSRRSETWSMNARATINLEGMTWFLDRAKVFARDYPRQPILEGDWIYGADSLIADLSGEITNEVVEFWRGAGVTSGTFTITDGTDTTANIDAFATNTQVRSAILDPVTGISGILDCRVTGDGALLTPWLIEITDPAGTNYPDLSVGTNNTDGNISVSVLRQGGTLSPRPWHESRHPVTGVIHGNYQVFQISTTEVPAGDTYSLEIDIDDIDTETDYAGAQVILNVNPGQRYRATMPVFAPVATGATDFRLIVRNMTEGYIASSPDTTVTAGAWQTLSTGVFFVPEGVYQVILRLGVLEAANHGVIYAGIESATFAPGSEAATFGAIMTELLDACVARGTLTWLNPTWSDTLDSAGVAWDRSLSWAIAYRQSLKQLVDYARRWGYESVIEWNDGTSQFDWHLYNRNGAGTVQTLTIVGADIDESGPVTMAPPLYTSAIAEGGAGAWGEASDATLVSRFGRLEGYVSNRQGRDSTLLADLASELVTDAATNMDGRRLRLQAGSPRPFVDFDRLDVVNVNLQPLDAKVRDLRVAAMTVTHEATVTGAPVVDVHLNRRTFGPESAEAQTVRTLARRFSALEGSLSERVGIVDPATSQPDLTAVGGAIPYLIAASDAPQEWKDVAQYQCDGVDDWPTWNQAINDARNVGAVGSRILLSPGRFYLDDNAGSYLFPLLTDGFVIEGCGPGVTIVRLIGTTTADSAIFTAGSSHVTIRNFEIEDFGSFGHRVDLFDMADNCTLENVHGYIAGSFATLDGVTACRVSHCVMEGGGGGGVGVTPAIEIAGPPVSVEIVDNVIDNWFTNSSAAIWMLEAAFSQYATDFVVARNIIRGTTGGGIHMRSTGGSTFGNQIIDNVIDGSNDHGIYLESFLVSNISGNVITNQNVGDCIRLEDCGASVDPVLVSDNICTRAFANAIHVLGVSEAIHVVDNFIEEANDAGILLAGTLDKATVIGNRVIPGGTDRGIYISASTVTDALVVGNDLRERSGGQAFVVAPITDLGTGTVFTWPNDATYGDNFSDAGAGLGPGSGAGSGALFVATADKAVANTTAETSLFGTGEGSLTLPADYLVPGRTLEIDIRGRLAATGNPNRTIRLKLGATTITSLGPTAIASVSGTVEFRIQLTLTCRSAGATGVVVAGGVWSHSNGVFRSLPSGTNVTVDTTGTLALDVTFEWGTASASNTITAREAIVS